MKNKITLGILIVLSILTLFLVWLGIDYIKTKKEFLTKSNNIESGLTELQGSACGVYYKAYPYPYGNKNGVSMDTAELKCGVGQKLISGGCDIVLGGGPYADFGGVENVGHMMNRPNSTGDGWLCGFYGGDMNGSFLDKGVWDLTVYTYCCDK